MNKEVSVDWHELEKKKVTELRELATEHANVEGASALPKEKLVEIVAGALGIERPHLIATGINKTALKQKIRSLRLEVQQGIEAKDRVLVRRKRRQIHRLKRRIRRAAHFS